MFLFLQGLIACRGIGSESYNMCTRLKRFCSQKIRCRCSILSLLPFR